MKCTKIFKAKYVSKATGEEKEGVFAQFDNGNELKMIGTVEENVTKITDYKAENIDPKDMVVTRQGEYGPYACFTSLTAQEELA